MTKDVFFALFGGVLIGLSATILLLFLGRIAGLSGILSQSLFYKSARNTWHLSFLGGFLFGGVLVALIRPEALVSSLNLPYVQLLLGAFLVGFGSLMAGGCTSGHGVCGIARLSPRSIVATLVFIFFGILTVSLSQHWLVL